MKLRDHRFKNVIFLIFLFFFIWVLLQFLAPLMLPYGSVSDLSGSAGVSDNDYLIQKMSFPWNVVYGAGDRLCHQRADRSLFLNGNEMPFCSRCTAIWLGLAIGLAFMVFYTIDLNERFLIAMVAALLPIGIDGIGQLVGFWESSNPIRILTGLPAGIICGVAIGIIVDEISSLHVFTTIHIFKKPKA
jgi:uncharacterized membrane protein